MGGTALNIRPALHTVAWSAATAALVAIMTVLGAVYESGRNQALGITALTVPAIEQRHIIYIGAELLLHVVFSSVLLLVIGRCAYLVGPRGSRWTSPGSLPA